MTIASTPIALLCCCCILGLLQQFVCVVSFGSPRVPLPRLSFRSVPSRTVGKCNRDPFRIYSSSDDDEAGGRDQQQSLREKAQKLRDQAQQLEQELEESATPRRKNQSVDATTKSPAVMVTRLENSAWVLSYRFSSQPRDDDDDKDTTRVQNYSGTLTVRLLDDGYSQLLSQNSRGLTGSDDLDVVKVWGWDEEYSQEDQEHYLLFSADVKLPATDPFLPDQTERYYFQARIDRESETKRIVLSDGTVTVKKDVAEKTKGRWGLFQVAGILTEFRYVGNFGAKPTNADEG